MTGCVIRSVGIAAPGLAGWDAAREVLRGTLPYAAVEETAYAPALLPPNERRRATASVRQAFRAAEDAVRCSDARQLASVFASSDADMAVLHRICAALAQTTRSISPTDFHNSVHNAASGYWSIAVQSTAPTTTLSAYDASFTAGLIEAAALTAEHCDVLLVAYDAIAPQPLLDKRPLTISAGVALILGRPDQGVGAASLGRIDLTLGGSAESVCANAPLEAARGANPALRALPLLELIATRCAGTIVLRGSGALHVTVGYSP